MSIVSPNKSVLFKNTLLRQDENITTNDLSISKKRQSPKHSLQPVSPNVSRTIETPKSKFQRPTLSSIKPSLNIRSKTTISTKSNNNPFKLRRANSLIQSSSSFSDIQSSTTDRFIPSRHNSTTGKLETSNEQLLPNASPQSHIKAQTSKIYQHHVAEACGLQVNSRILLYKPQPPERKKPLDLYSNPLNKMTNRNMITPSQASARAKKIPSAPDRVLDAPGIVDDFYLNLLAWSSTNLLAIGLEDAVYVWNASTGSVGLLCELANKSIVTSLKWSDDGSYISIGKDDGTIEIWDIETNTKLRTISCGHLTRIASQSWSNHVLTSGSRMGNMYHSDVRIASHLTTTLTSHQAEICGIEYKQDGSQFASGGNDNLVCIWDIKKSDKPIFIKSNHKAAVKALSWCPYQPNLLATGGGSTDKTVHFWNTSIGSRVNTIETGSQVSSLNWGYAHGIGMEIVATHGFPTNNISIFNYPTLQKTGEINNAHDTRILNGVLSPDKLTLATVAGDENLKFWSLFDLQKNNKRDMDNLDDFNETNEAKRMKKIMNLR